MTVNANYKWKNVMFNPDKQIQEKLMKLKPKLFSFFKIFK